MPRLAWGAALVGCCALVAASWGVWWIADTLGDITGWPR